MTAGPAPEAQDRPVSEAAVEHRAADPAVGPAQVYVMHHPDKGAVKIGYCAMDSARLAAHQHRGWILAGAVVAKSSAEALKIEQSVLVQLRNPPFRLHPFVPASQMPQSGWTETFDASLMPPALLLRLVEDAPARMKAQASEARQLVQQRARDTEPLVREAAVEAAHALPPGDGDALTRGQLYALFGRPGALWYERGIDARYTQGEVRLRNGPVMLGAIAVDAATMTITGPYRVWLYKKTNRSAEYTEAALETGVLPTAPIAERQRRLPPPPPRPVRC